MIMGLTCLGLVIHILAFSIPKTRSQSSSREYQPFHAARIQNHRNNDFNGGQLSPFQIDSRVESPTNSPHENLDINYRAQVPSNYRNFYRNRNYFVQPGDNEHQLQKQDGVEVDISGDQKYITTGSSNNADYSNSRAPTVVENGDSGFATSVPEKSVGSYPNVGGTYVRPTSTYAIKSSEVTSDSPILFSPSNTPMHYIRPVQHFHTSTPPFFNTVAGREATTFKDVRLKSTYVPTLDDKLDAKCPKNSAYCEDFDNYPTQLIDDVITKSYTPEKFQEVYGESTDNTSKVIDLKAILQRNGLNSGSPVEETPLCSSVEHTIYPRVAKNKENKWMYIVNHAEYIQGVRVEKCLDEAQSCFFGDAVPVGYQTACRQKFIYKKLLALTQEGKTSTDTFRLPSCCVCLVKTTTLADRLSGLIPSTHKQSVGGVATSSAPKTTIPMSSDTQSFESHDGLEFMSDQAFPMNATTIKVSDD